MDEPIPARVEARDHPRRPGRPPLDIAFLFWAIAVGIVPAARMIPLAVFGSVIIGVMLLVFVNKKSSVNPYIVVLQCENQASEQQAQAFLEEHTRRCVVKSKTVQPGLIELNFEVRLDGDDTGFVNGLCAQDGVQSAALVIDNEAYKNVGLRAKGNTSLSSVAQMGSDRYSFKIEFDHYGSGKSYHGLDKLCLNNAIQDNTFMKDYLAYQLMAAFGANAPLCSFAYITVNGAASGTWAVWAPPM